MATKTQDIASKSSALEQDSVSSALLQQVHDKHQLQSWACGKPPEKPTRRDSEKVDFLVEFNASFIVNEEDDDHMTATDESGSVASDFSFSDFSDIFRSLRHTNLISREQRLHKLFLDTLPHTTGQRYESDPELEFDLAMESDLNYETFSLVIPVHGPKSVSSVSLQSLHSRFECEDQLSIRCDPVVEHCCPREMGQEKHDCKSPPSQPQRRTSNEIASKRPDQQDDVTKDFGDEKITNFHPSSQDGSPSRPERRPTYERILKFTENCPLTQDEPPSRPERRPTHEGLNKSGDDNDVMDRVMLSTYRDIKPSWKTSKPQHHLSAVNKIMANEEEIFNKQQMDMELGMYSVPASCEMMNIPDAVVRDSPPSKPKRRPTYEKASNLLEDEGLNFCIDAIYRTICSEFARKEHLLEKI